MHRIQGLASTDAAQATGNEVEIKRPRGLHQTPIGDLLGVLESGASDGGGSGELITVPVLTVGPSAGGAELEQPTSATQNAAAINRCMFLGLRI